MGNRTCGACPSGYAGDGWRCSDVNECLSGNGGCHAQAVCSNTPGSRRCACKAGYQGNGIGGAGCIGTLLSLAWGARSPGLADPFRAPWLADIDECASNNGGCFRNVTCYNNAGNRTCDSCPRGYTGDGFTCTGERALSLASASLFCVQFPHSHALICLTSSL
jgi:hypothetical protein